MDWELSTLGHPLSDLANLLQALDTPSKQDHPSSPFMFGLLQAPNREELAPSLPDLLKRYCQGVKRVYPIKGWDFCVAFAFFKMAVITQGIAARLKAGQASSAQASYYASLYGPLCKLAMERMQLSQSL